MSEQGHNVSAKMKRWRIAANIAKLPEPLVRT